MGGSKKKKKTGNIFDIVMGRFNKWKGEIAENVTRTRWEQRGWKMKKRKKGCDFVAEKRDPRTGKVVDKMYVEVKSGNARLSKKQKEEKKKYGKKVKVERVNDPFFFGMGKKRGPWI